MEDSGNAMKNANIALALGIVVIGILAAEGKLKDLWDAVMSAGGPTSSSGGGSTSASGSASRSSSGPPSLAPPGNPFGQLAPSGSAGTNTSAANNYGIGKLLNGPQNTNLTQFPSQPGMPGYDAVNAVFAKWPAGHQAEWDAFRTCYVTTGGNIADCAARGFVLSSEGVG